MVLITGTHATSADVRPMIESLGLIPHSPGIDGNYTREAEFVPEVEHQPRGVYLVQLEFGLREAPRGWWKVDSEQHDVWEAAFTGPVMHDPLIDGAIVSLQPIPPESLTLVREAIS